MWTLQYNGITLQVHHADSIRREAVFAGPTYIHTRFRLSVQAIYNPSLNAYANLGPGVVAPAPAGAVIQAALTDLNLRHRLLQLRKPLVFTVAGIHEMVSPLPGYTVDANNGPVV